MYMFHSDRCAVSLRCLSFPFLSFQPLFPSLFFCLPSPTLLPSSLFQVLEAQERPDRTKRRTQAIVVLSLKHGNGLID